MAGYFSHQSWRRAALVSVLFGLLTLVLLLQSTTAFGERLCVVCHAGSEWAPTDGHATVGCEDCHSGRGAFGALDMRVRLTAMVGAYATGTDPAAEPVDSARCRRCHEEVLGAALVADGIRMSHAAPARSGWQCVDCHAAGIHGEGRAGRPGIAMDECLRCHVVSGRSNDCALCHVAEVSPEQRVLSGSYAKTHGPERAVTHGMGDLQSCDVCHTSDLCVECHGLELPHSYGWLNDHGPAEAGVECASCHTEKFCSDCHEVPIPHAPDYMSAHPAEAIDAGQEACLKCHDGGSCVACHLGHVHPGIDADRMRRLRAQSGLD